MTSRDEARKIAGEVLDESGPVRLADMSEETAAYFRAAGAAQGATTDAEVEALMAANHRTSEPDLDKVVADRRSRRGGLL